MSKFKKFIQNKILKIEDDKNTKKALKSAVTNISEHIKTAIEKKEEEKKLLDVGEVRVLDENDNLIETTVVERKDTTTKVTDALKSIAENIVTQERIIAKKISIAYQIYSVATLLFFSAYTLFSTIFTWSDTKYKIIIYILLGMYALSIIGAKIVNNITLRNKSNNFNTKKKAVDNYKSFLKITRKSMVLLNLTLAILISVQSLTVARPEMLLWQILNVFVLVIVTSITLLLIVREVKKIKTRAKPKKVSWFSKSKDKAKLFFNKFTK